MKVSLNRQVQCVEREIAMRNRVYPRAIASGKMKPSHASLEIGDMEAVLATLKWLAENELMIRAKLGGTPAKTEAA